MNLLAIHDCRRVEFNWESLNDFGLFNPPQTMNVSGFKATSQFGPSDGGDEDPQRESQAIKQSGFASAVLGNENGEVGM